MSLPSAALMQGWLTGAGLIVAIGAQNALVLRQGLMRQHVAPVVMVCALSDMLLIWLGVFGLGRLIAASPLLMEVFRWGGALFLLAYSLTAARRALWPKAGLQAQAGSASLTAVLSSTLAMTYLNPHVYLDTVVLLGTLGAQQPAAGQTAFAVGASVASWMWFSLLGFGAAAVAVPLRRPAVWRSIDAVIALVMAWLGLQLLLRPLG
ncbi:LysE/ArgO family amino acid transporter [Roseateles amylovorans]|uniref:LysE/ArgO family amino acid transporter n=1 Tax=Roseateles amylovorans TaxID=2978473 RepID=A0ABY6AZL5_9BURK|nr:LysE/ArgO family amino acid transporter [Roseateles amylovorans]UXH78611.1 LysE/ArgO family amino acid transporter [Roseateles amylovorans]